MLARRLGLDARTAPIAVAACGLIAACGVVVAMASSAPAVTVERDEASTTSASTTSAATTTPVVLTVVHVDGAVAVAGVYRLEVDGPRVADAVQAAGGLTDEADTSQINLAAPITDGSKVHVPAVVEDAVAAPAEQGSAQGSSQATSSLVNINMADQATLETLPGVGPSTATSIIQERTDHGPFASPEDLMRVSGIGEKKYAKLEGLICV